MSSASTASTSAATDPTIPVAAAPARALPGALARFDLTGRVALVTGASRGIGLALARGLGEAGARVVLNARGGARLDAALAALRAAGIAAEAAPFDVTDAAAIERGVAAIEAEIGPIAILVNNAGMQHRAPAADFAEADWRRLQATNVDSVFFVSQAVGRRMLARRAGRIINIGSVQSELGRPSIAPYCVSKGAVKMLTRALAAEWGPMNIQVNGIGPGYFRTELNAALVADPGFSAWVEKRTPAGRWGEVEELVGAAIFLASDAACYINGQMLMVDGGMTSVV
ncbi:SDR family oxidoreductase [Rhabdaerophilum calidifontis]|uniref:SDR family oxidoreductase n=1 Tax=Rhabdaerophilum calidifontis TaxID=2604328 RepID=UPI00123A73B7|nr:SDR family oxidoreductase [Rhabdaerophilum calidifontis]